MPPAPLADRPPLRLDTILTAAEELLAAEGVEGLSLRRIARELGVSPMALYRHVADKDELLLLLVDRLAERLPRPELP